MTDDDFEPRLAGELKRAHDLTLQFEPAPALMLVSLIQLATRTPLAPESAEFAAEVVTAACLHFRGFPTVLELIERGNDPAYDVQIVGEHDLSRLWGALSYSEQAAISELALVLPDSLQGRHWEHLNNDERESVREGVRRLVLLADRLRGSVIG